VVTKAAVLQVLSPDSLNAAYAENIVHGALHLQGNWRKPPVSQRHLIYYISTHAGFAQGKTCGHLVTTASRCWGHKFIYSIK
jgi:hypothetical protein